MSFYKFIQKNFRLQELSESKTINGFFFQPNICNKNSLFDNYNYNITAKYAHKHNKYAINNNELSLSVSSTFRAFTQEVAT